MKNLVAILLAATALLTQLVLIAAPVLTMVARNHRFEPGIVVLAAATRGSSLAKNLHTSPEEIVSYELDRNKRIVKSARQPPD